MTGETSAEDDEDAARTTRRSFMRVTAAGAAAAAGATGGASAQAETYRFGGEVAAWRGRAPSSIEGEDNPTLELEAGTQYEVVWENVDGAPHDFTIQDSGGQNLVATDQISEEGATASMTFEATADMAQYICTIHPTTMVGDIEVSGGSAGGQQEETGIPAWSLLIAGGLAMMFLSPLVFALFLFSRRREEPTPR